MKNRAGIILIEENKLALIERHRQGLNYFAFPGGGIDEEKRGPGTVGRLRKSWELLLRSSKSGESSLIKVSKLIFSQKARRGIWHWHR